MSSATSGLPRYRRVLIVVVVCLIAIGAVIAGVIAVRSGDDDTSLPPLTAAEQQAGAIRVIYPDRSLPDDPERAVVGNITATLYFVRVEGSGDDVTATLRVGTDATIGDLPTEVTLGKGQSQTVNGLVVTLLEAFNTGDPAHDAADVTVALAE